ncbi:hypothetical protein ACWDUL_08685 [Nocardia niigatensis]
MNEKHPTPDSSNEAPSEEPEQPDAVSDEARSVELQLTWEVGEILLRAVNAARDHSAEDVRSQLNWAVMDVIETLHRFRHTTEFDTDAATKQAAHVTGRLLDLVEAVDAFTTSDLQGAVDALAIQLVRNRLQVNDA